MDIELDIENNPHILLGRGLWAISVGNFYAALDADDDTEHSLGFLAFHPVINPPPVDHIDDVVSVDNIADVSNPPMSLVFSSVESAERMLKEIETVIRIMKGDENG